MGIFKENNTDRERERESERDRERERESVCVFAPSRPNKVVTAPIIISFPVALLNKKQLGPKLESRKNPELVSLRILKKYF